MRHLATAVLIVSMLAQVGCRTLPEPPAAEVPVAVPAGWQSGGDAGGYHGAASWLAGLEEPEMDRLIREGLANNQNLRASSARVKAAAAAIIGRNAARMPVLDFGADAGRSERSGGSAVTSLSIGPTISWEADLWGRLRGQRDAAAADSDAVAWTDSGLQLSIAVAIARGWCNAITDRQRVAMAEGTIASYRQSLAVVEDQYRAGIVTASDVHLARASLAGGEALLHAGHRSLAQEIRTLEALVGRYPDGTLVVPATLPSITAVPAGVPSEVLLRRPDLRAADARLRASGLRSEVADKLRWPSLRLTAAGGASAPLIADLLNSNQLLWSVAAGLTQPLFEGGKIQADQAQARALQEEAAATWAQAVLDAFQEVESALAAEQYLVAQVQALTDAVTASTAAEDQVNGRYRDGLADLTAVLVAQRRALDARSSLIQARNALLQNRLSLVLALGGGLDLKN